METILEVNQVAKHFGGFTALHSIDLQLQKGERLGLIGPNGSGKTTLINCISGALQNDAGSIKFNGRELTGMQAFQRTRLGIARSFQIPRPFRSMTVLENLMVPLAYVGGISGHKAQEEAMRILTSMGLAAKAQTISGSLSQVELRKMELARAMRMALDHSEPKRLIPGEWHLPYVNASRDSGGVLYYYIGDNLESGVALSQEQAIKVSAARCAAVSFRNVDYGLEKCEEVYARLVGDERKHASALEHQATPMKVQMFSVPNPHDWEEGVSHMDKNFNLWSGNLRGWIQWRKLVPGENVEG